MGEIEKRVKEILILSLGEELELDELGLNDSFVDYGIHSLNFVKAVIAIESEFDIEFEIDDLDINGFKDLKSLTDFIKKNL